MNVVAWFGSLPPAVRVVLVVAVVLVLIGVVLGLLQAARLLPGGWSAERFRAWFGSKRGDE